MKRRTSKKGHFIPLPPSRQIPGVTTVLPPAKAPAVRLASYDPEAPAQHIEQWWGDAIPVGQDTKALCRKTMAVYETGRLMCDYDFTEWLAWLPYWPELKESDQFYKVAEEDDED